MAGPPPIQRRAASTNESEVDLSHAYATTLSFTGLPEVPQRGVIASLLCKGVDKQARKARVKEIEARTKAHKEVLAMENERKELQSAMKMQVIEQVLTEKKRQADVEEKKRQKENEDKQRDEAEKRQARAHELELLKLKYDFELKKLHYETAAKQVQEGMADKLRQGGGEDTKRQRELKERGPIQESADNTGEEDLSVAHGLVKHEVMCSMNTSTTECTLDSYHDVEEVSTDDSVDLRIAAVIRLHKLQREFGRFSYSVWKDELVVHLEDERARRNETALTAAILKVSKLFNGQKEVPVKVIGQSLGAVLCSPLIGAKLEVNSSPQTTGMYVLHQGVVHWVSVAHHFLRLPELVADTPHGDVDPVVYATLEVASRRVRIDFDDVELMANADPLVPSPMTYPCLRHMPLDNRGRRLLHSVDIMIGPVPMVAKRASRHPESLDTLRSVWMCDECNFIGCAHANAKMIYEIDRVLQPTLYAGVRLENYARYDPIIDPKYDCYKFVTALLPGRNVVHGLIEPAFADIDFNGQKYINVLYISSTNGVSPRLGDSGSIWVSKRSSEAVAITVGKAPCGSRGEVWVAVFLLPSLHVFCKQHRQSFADIRELQSIRGGVLVGSDDQ